MLKLLITTLLILSCAKPTIEPAHPMSEKTQAIGEKLQELRAKAKEISLNGWLVSESCDAMLWSAISNIGNADYFRFELAEDENKPGKFYRTQSKDCYELAKSGSEWSRDMGLALLIYLYLQGDLKTIERHIAYGEANNWVMGKGLISRTYYTSALQSLWYKAAKKLGHNYGMVIVQNVYWKNLVDFEARLQAFDIFLNGEIDGAISETMFARVAEHSKRIPASGFYAFVKGKYSGGISRSVDICLDDSNIVNDYVRCDGEPCELAERIFTCQLVYNFLKGK